MSELHGNGIAFLIANGFDEMALTTVQKALVKEGLKTHNIAPETAVVNGWNGQGWGCFFTVDTPINQALASDFSGLIIPNGQRALDKLAKTAHTRRIVENFLRAGKPVLFLGPRENAMTILSEIATDHLAQIRFVGETAEELETSVTQFVTAMGEVEELVNAA
ncbi:MAG: DJ-1/PfpI family protein [Pseudobdellovibrionaceae bacterium]